MEWWERVLQLKRRNRKHKFHKTAKLLTMFIDSIDSAASKARSYMLVGMTGSGKHSKNAIKTSIIELALRASFPTLCSSFTRVISENVLATSDVLSVSLLGWPPNKMFVSNCKPLSKQCRI